MARLKEDHEPCWFDAPVRTDLRQSHARLRRDRPVNSAGGEHEFTRRGATPVMDMGACDIYQTTPLRTGGISETVKIFTLAST